MGFRQRDFVRVTLRSGCPGSPGVPHRPEEDGRYGQIVFHHSGDDHRFSVYWLAADGETGDPIADRVLGFYGDDELEPASPAPS